MWTIKARRKKLDGPLGCYNSLTDKHLTRYFSNRTVRQHLIKAGLLTKEGNIVPDSTRYSQEVEQKRHKDAHEVLANAIVQKTIELERVHKAEVKRHLEDMYKIEIVERVKSSRAKNKGHSSSCHKTSSRLALLTSALPTNKVHPKTSRWSESTFPLSCSLPSSLSNNSVQKSSFLRRTCQSAKEAVKLNTTERNAEAISCRSKSAGSGEKNSERMQCSYRDAIKTLLESSVSPYLLPVFSKYAATSETKWHKSAIHRKLDKAKQNGSEEITSIDKCEEQKNTNSRPSKSKYIKLRKFPDSLPQITLLYRGLMSIAACPSPNSYQEVTIMQQHCGGNPICVFKNQLKGGDSFSFISRRHLGYPFSIIIFISGIQHLRISTCCEYRHRLGYRLGGKRGVFILTNVQGSKPCFRCQVEESLGLIRPHHPKPPEYSKYLRKPKKVAKIANKKTSGRKKIIASPPKGTKEFSNSSETQKEEDNDISPASFNEENNSDSENTDHSEILESCFQNNVGDDSSAEEIPSEDDQDEIQEQIVGESTDDQLRGLSPENTNAGDLEESEEVKETHEVDEEKLQGHSKSISYHPSGGSDGDDDVVCNETCMSFDYTADSDEEPVDEDEHDSHNEASSFAHKKSLYSADDAYEQDSNVSNGQLELNYRRESTDTLNSDVQDNVSQWQNKLECPQSYSSSDEEGGMKQQVVTADIHINPSNLGTKNITKRKENMQE